MGDSEPVGLVTLGADGTRWLRNRFTASNKRKGPGWPPWSHRLLRCPRLSKLAETVCIISRYLLGDHSVRHSAGCWGQRNGTALLLASLKEVGGGS